MAEPEPWLVMFSGSPWSAGAHRQQQLARLLSRTWRVLFCEPPDRPARDCRFTAEGPTLWRVRVPSAGRVGRLVGAAERRARIRTAEQVDRWLTTTDAAAGHDIGAERILWLDEDLAGAMVGRLDERAVVYDATDLDWVYARRFRRPRLRRALRHSLDRADLVLASSAALPALLPGGPPAVLVPNGWADQTRDRQPDRLARLPHPRVVYLGTLDARVDPRLLIGLATARPHWTFVVGGPVGRGGRSLPARLSRLPNVTLLGSVPPARVPALLAGSDLGLIPYRIRGSCVYAQPAKLYELLAAGLPVLSTPLPGLPPELLGPAADVRVAADLDGWVRAADELLARNGFADRARRRRIAAGHRWTDRADQILTLLAPLLESGATQPVGSGGPR